MNKNNVKTKYKYKRCNGSHTKLTWSPSGVTYFARDPLRSFFHDPQKNEIYFLNIKPRQQQSFIEFRKEMQQQQKTKVQAI